MNNFWKALGLTIILLTIGIESFSQERSVTIGYYNEVTTYFPIDRNANYSRWEGIYTSTEIGSGSGYLKTLKFYWLNNQGNHNLSNIKIFVRGTDANELSDGDIEMDGYIMVYEGDMYHLENQSILTFDLQHPFYYDGVSNIQILIEHGYQSYALTPMEWVIFPTEANQSRWASSDEGKPTSLNCTSSKPELTIELGCLFANAGGHKSGCLDKAIQLGDNPTATGTGSQYTYQWVETTYLDTPTVSNPHCIPMNEVEYLEYVVHVASEECSEGVTSTPVKINVCNGSQLVMGERQQKASICGEIDFMDSGTGGDYSYNEDYKMTVYPCNSNYVVGILFNEFEIEGSDNCEKDWLKIYDGENEEAPLLGMFCGKEIPPEIQSHNILGALTFVFHSDGNGTGPGWNAKLFQVLKDCDLAKGIATISSSGDYVHSGSATINLTSYAGTFDGWEYSYNGVNYLPIANSTPSWNTFNNTVTYYRAIINTDKSTCYSDAVKYNTSRNFYINDNSTVGDQWCTAVGNINNHALSPDKPITGLNPLMNKYSLNQGDTIFWDAGSYTESGFNINDTIVGDSSVCILGADSLKTKLISCGEIFIRNTQEIELNRLHIEHSSLVLSESKNILIQNCSITGAGAVIQLFSAYVKAEHITIRNNYFEPMLYSCIENNGQEMSDITIESNVFINDERYVSSNYFGIYLMSMEYGTDFKNIRIRHNYFRNFAIPIYFEPIGNGIYSGIEIKNNWIENQYSYPDLNAGIQLMNIKSSSASPMIVEGNRIRGYQYSVYSDGVENARINSNFLSLSKTGLFSAGSKQVSILNNSFSNTLSNINFGTGNNTGIKVLNNIFSIEPDTIPSDTGICIITGSQDTLSECNYNLYYGTGTAQISKYNGSIISSLESWKRQNHSLSGGDENSLFGNPGFTDVSAGDLTICDNSPAYQKGTDILEPINDISGASAQSPFSIGAHLNYVPLIKNGPYAVLKKKLDGGYHYSKGLYLQLKYTEEYNPGTNAKLKFRVFDQNHEEIFVSTWNQPYTGIKYGDNYLSIYKVGCNNNNAMHLPDGYYLLEVSNDKNEKWYLRFYSKIEPAEQAVTYPCPTSNQIPSGYTLKTL